MTITITMTKKKRTGNLSNLGKELRRNGSLNRVTFLSNVDRLISNDSMNSRIQNNVMFFASKYINLLYTPFFCPLSSLELNDITPDDQSVCVVDH